MITREQIVFSRRHKNEKMMNKLILILLGVVLVGLAALVSVKADCDTDTDPGPNTYFFE